MSNYEPEENESGEYEIDFKWDAVMAGATATPSPAEPVAADLALDDFTEADKRLIEDAVRSLPIGPGTYVWPKGSRVTSNSPWPAATDTPPSPAVNPAHYDVLGLMPWEAFDRGWLTKPEFIGHLRGSALEYVARAPHKNGAEDYRKAIRCLEKLLSLLAES